MGRRTAAQIETDRLRECNAQLQVTLNVPFARVRELESLCAAMNQRVAIATEQADRWEAAAQPHRLTIL